MKSGITNTPVPVATSRWITDIVTPLLRERDKIKDLAFRERMTDLGPSGWVLLVDIKSVPLSEHPEGVTSGCNFTKPGKPTRSEIEKTLSSMYEKVEKVQKDEPSGLISKPAPGDINRIARGQKKMLTGAEPRT